MGRLLRGKEKMSCMEKMKIAVSLDENYRPEEGGGFSYYNRLIKAIDGFQFDPSLDICFVTENTETNDNSHHGQKNHACRHTDATGALVDRYARSHPQKRMDGKAPRAVLHQERNTIQCKNQTAKLGNVPRTTSHRA